MTKRRRALVFAAVMALVFGWAGGWTSGPGGSRAPETQAGRPPSGPAVPSNLEGGALGAGTGVADTSPEIPKTPKRVEGSWFVALRPDLDPTVVADGLARRYGGRAEHIYELTLHGFNYRGTDADLKHLRDDPMVDDVAPDYEVHAVEETITNPVRRIRASHPTATNAFDSGFTGTGVNIGILDTGVDFDHQDLADNIAPQARWMNCVGGAPTDIDDGNGHGTRTAGNAAAVANSVGVRGVAPQATIIPIKVLGGGGGGSTATVACGVEHLTALANANPTERFIGNMSLAGGGGSSSCAGVGLRQAICESVAADVVHTAAAGNARANAAGYWPANFPEVIAVSALSDSNGEPGGDSMAGFSNYGDVVDVTAPGVNVLSPSKGGGYTTTSGTSRAAPHVAGVGALILSADPGLSPQEVLDLMLATGECPDGTTNTASAACPGATGDWSGDLDSETEPLVSALNASLGADPGLPRISFNAPTSQDELVGNNVLVDFEVQDADDSGVAQAGVASVVLKADATVLESWTSPSIGSNFMHAFDSSTLADGSHGLSVTVTDNDDKTRTASIAVVIANAPPEFSEDFEPAPSGWTLDGLWHVADGAPGSTGCPDPFSSYRRSLYYGQDASCDYDTGKTNKGVATSPVISGLAEEASLTFDAFRSVETTGKKRDRARLYLSYDGGRKWRKVWERTARDPADTGWTSHVIELHPTAGTVRLRFYFNADRRENSNDGWFIDDLLVQGGPNDQPEPSFIAPANGATVSGASVPIEIDAIDEDAPGSLTVDLYVDGALLGSATWNGTDAYETTWDSTTVPDAFHTLEARSTDSGGAVGSVLIDVNVDNVP